MALRDQARRLGRWLDDRIGLSALAPLAKKKHVPVHKHTFWYYLGGMALFLFGLQIATGVLLLFYYRPSDDHAFESIQFLMTDVRFGWLIRSLHSWGANLMVFIVFAHMFSTYLLKAYRAPRELTWLSGAALFVLVLGLGFTGYLLPWNTLAFFATRVGTEIPGVLPVVGPALREFLRGGEDVTGATLTRFYALHISVLPGIALILIVFHALLVQRHGMSEPEPRPGRPPARTMSFFPDFMLRDLVGWLCALAMLAALAALFPAHLGEKADAFAPAPAGIRPEWYFMFMFQTLKYLPAEILGIEGELVGIAAFGVAAIVLFLMPFLDGRRTHPRIARFWSLAAWGALAYILLLTWLGYTASPTA